MATANSPGSRKAGNQQYVSVPAQRAPGASDPRSDGTSRCGVLARHVRLMQSSSGAFAWCVVAVCRHCPCESGLVWPVRSVLPALGSSWNPLMGHHCAVLWRGWIKGGLD